MAGETLYHCAVEMLRATNVYAKPIESLSFVKDENEYSLTGLLKDNTNYGQRAATGNRCSVEERKKRAYLAICESLEDYVEYYPATYSVKQRIRGKFIVWLKDIQKKYRINLEDQEFNEYFEGKSTDTVIAMLQILQNPEGVTKEDMAADLHISPRAVLKNLCRLDHSLGESEQTGESFYIGGQPVQAKIKAFRRGKDRKRRYRIVNTIHPIVLQENVMQAGILIQALARNYETYGNDTSYCIGMDIWSQLSEYAKVKIRSYFAYGDQEVGDYVRMLDDDCPDAKMAFFYTEREMVDEFSIRKDETLLFCMKAENRRCNLTLLLDGETRTFEAVHLRRAVNETTDRGKIFYKAICTDSNEILFSRDQLIDISLL